MINVVLFHPDKQGLFQDGNLQDKKGMDRDTLHELTDGAIVVIQPIVTVTYIT